MSLFLSGETRPAELFDDCSFRLGFRLPQQPSQSEHFGSYSIHVAEFTGGAAYRNPRLETRIQWGAMILGILCSAYSLSAWKPAESLAYSQPLEGSETSVVKRRGARYRIAGNLTKKHRGGRDSRNFWEAEQPVARL
jgi:hypothetical protein